MTRDVMTLWHEVVEAKDEALLRDLLDADAVFESPVVHSPQVGRDITAKYLMAAFSVLNNDSFHYLGRWDAEGSAVLEFATEIDGVKINGVDLIFWNDQDLITNFRVMLRPLKGINKVHEKMAEMLAQRAG